MNRFRTKKRTERKVEVKKKQQQQPEVDLSQALPSTDDFRTSLLMPNLSARFSMLREQDDPMSKLGKANDDSVLFPKRASRLNLFGNLGDIAEVSSITSSVRPPTGSDRVDSFVSVDGYPTDDDSSHNGSVMARARPGEGNNLFGGRQKIYKIRDGSATTANLLTMPSERKDSISGMSGRAVYDHDVGLSAFQLYKQKEREERERLEQDEQEKSEEAEKASNPNWPLPNRSPSPQLPGYNTDRETSSSTMSGPYTSRTSTAATSIASQSAVQLTLKTKSSGELTPAIPESTPGGFQSPHLERTLTKSRRMYGQVLDQEMADQQNSAIGRLNSLQRQRALSKTQTPTTPILMQSKSATNLSDRFRQKPFYTSLRNNSPTSRDSPPLATSTSLGGFNLGLDEPKPSDTTPLRFGQDMPLSPPISEAEDIKTSLKVDNPTTPSTGSPLKETARFDEDVQPQEERELPVSREVTPSVPKIDVPVPLARNLTDVKPPSPLRLSPRRPQISVETNALPSGMPQIPLPSIPKKSSAREELPSGGTFLGETDSGSSANSDEEREQKPSLKQNDTPSENKTTPQPPLGGFDFGEAVSKPRIHVAETAESDDMSVYDDEPDEEPEAGAQGSQYRGDDFGMDSPTLGPEPGLSGLIRSHLRQDSDLSSIYPPSPEIRPRLPQSRDVSPMDSGRLFDPPASVHSNPWEFDDFDGAYGPEKVAPKSQTPPEPSAMPPAIPSMVSQQILERAMALREQNENSTKSASVRDYESPLPSPAFHASGIQAEIRASHSRGPSIDTQIEREEFESELAERKRQVQEKLRNHAESHSRSTSPIPSLRKATGLFKSRNNQNGPDKTSKAMKMFGLSSSGRASPRQEMWKDEEERMTQDFHRRPRNASVSRLNRPALDTRSPTPLQLFQPRDEDDQRSIAPSLRSVRTAPLPRPSDNQYQQPIGMARPRESEDNRSVAHSIQSSAPSSSGSRRDRSSSELSGGRSRSRTRPYREEMERGMENGPRMYGRYTPDEPPRGQLPAIPGRPSMDPVNSKPDSRSSSAMSGRYRSNSKSGPVYFDKSGYPIQHPSSATLPPRNSPMTPYSANSTPPIMEDSSGPSADPLPQAFPNGGNFQYTRKRSVKKSQISEPTFVSSTSSVNLVGLPAGASLSNGRDHRDVSPPIPPMNPRRRMTQANKSMYGGMPSSRGAPSPAPYDYSMHPMQERSVWSEDETQARSRSQSRTRLRKMPSEGGNLHAKSRQRAMNGRQSPAMPHIPSNVRLEGGMF
ncbi:MAG: hypothetical protein M1834_009408 [Cirrosporium novae-zelandiae]|nr:MAG: hypothetical protein M1834_009408 [Cirrosporium novae-zelandiae]